METTTTLGAITPGTVEHHDSDATVVLVSPTRKAAHNTVADFFDPEQTGSANNNAALYCDAHNTANKTGKLPSQLLAERDELVEALKPFADFGAAWIRMPAGNLPDECAVYAIHGSTEYGAEITIGQLKEAHRILSAITNHKP